MPRGKEFCKYEKDFFPVAAFKVVDGTKVHDVEPLHRATDGVLVGIEDGKLVELQVPPRPTPFMRR